MTPTPTSLLERLRQPFDPVAWTRFVSLYTPMIYSWARKSKLQEQDAHDLVQEVFVTLIRVLPGFTYDKDQSFRGWLRIVTLNTWFNLCKRKENRLREATGQVETVAVRDELAAAWDAEYQQHLAARALAIMKADFEESTWKACWEMAVQGRAAADIAAELSMTVGAVYAAKVRVLNRLRKELEGLLD